MARRRQIDPKSLTISWRQLMSLTIQDRMAFFRQGGESYFESLTPTDLAKLFPKYYLQQLPDMGKSLSGGTRGTIPTGEGAPSAAPSSRGPSAAPSARPVPSREKQEVPGRQQPAPSSEVKFSWQQRLAEAAEKARGSTTQSNERFTSSTRMNLSAYSPRAGGSAMEGDYRAARPGPGQGKQGYVNTLADFAAGKAQYVTAAGNPNMNGKRFIIPEISFYDKNGELKTLKNVPVVFHDTGRAFKNAPSDRADIPIDKDASDQMMAKSHALWSKQGIVFNQTETPEGRQPRQAETRRTEEESKTQKTRGFVDRTEEMKSAGYGSKSKPEPYKFIGVHYTGGESLSSAINHAKNANVGYQYLIDKDGTVHMVQNPDEGRANHWGKNNIHPEAKNSNSIGISFVGSSNKTITPEQRKAGLALINQQIKERGIDPRNVLGHGETTQNHREDTEGYGLLEPFRQQHGLTPQTGNMPNIASEGGKRAWQKGSYNYNLDSLNEEQTASGRLSQETTLPKNFEKLPQSMQDEINRLLSDDSTRAQGQNIIRNLSTLEQSNPEKFIETVTKLYDEAAGQEKNAQAAAVEATKTISDPGKISSLIQGVDETQQEVAGIRKLPLKDELKSYLNYATSQTGVKFEVTSGGQTRDNKTGSNRHNVDIEGTYGAADGRLYVEEDGKRRYLSVFNKEDRAKINDYVAAFTSVAPSAGIGANYMGRTEKDRGELIHIGGPNRPGDRSTNYSGSEYIGEGFNRGLSQYGKEETIQRFGTFRTQQEAARQADQNRTRETQPVVTAPEAPGPSTAEQPGVPQTVPQGSVPQQPAPTATPAPASPPVRQRGITDYAGYERGPAAGPSNADKPATAQGRIPGYQPPAATPSAVPVATPAASSASQQPMPEAKPIEENEYGGEYQTTSEDLVVADARTGVPQFSFNKDEEFASKDGRLKVTPDRMKNPDDIQPKMQNNFETSANQLNETVDVPQNTITQTPPTQINTHNNFIDRLDPPGDVGVSLAKAYAQSIGFHNYVSANYPSGTAGSIKTPFDTIVT